MNVIALIRLIEIVITSLESALSVAESDDAKKLLAELEAPVGKLVAAIENGKNAKVGGTD